MMIDRILIAIVLLSSSPWLLAADAINSKPVHFEKGSSSATLEGSLKGNRIVDYKLGARAGQTMSILLKTNNSANYFNVLPPGSQGEAIFIGSTSGNEWSGALPSDGEYSVRVYLMRSAARRNETADYTLTVGITGDADTSFGDAPASDAKVEGTPYHATGQVPCSLGDAPRYSAQCDFGVVRGKTGNAEVYVTPPGGFERILKFNGTMITSEGAQNLKVGQSDDWWSISVNDYEHYRIPDAVISGG